MGAKFEGGLDFNKLQKQFEQAEKDFTPHAEKAIEAAIKVYEEKTKDEITARDIIDTHALFLSVRCTGVVVTSDGAYAECYPTGTRTDDHHKKPERNETIAFVIEAGKGDKAGIPFMDSSAKKAKEPAAAAMAAEIEKALEVLK
ncbi:MAG: hypothetical protein PHO41_09900 [Eubacteriales bacterium]|nr:hypothetical protein [Eubacteriales bacterium]